VSVFPVMIYVLFGTSKHLSIGTFAIPAIMTAPSIMRYEGILYPSESDLSEGLNDTSQFLSTDINEGKIKIGMILALMVGVLQVLFAILHVGFVTKYLSDSIVSGFTCGAAIHIAISQIASLLGYNAKKSKLIFQLVGVS
jgi:MFS superfamily sulfate permease-like transporter